MKRARHQRGSVVFDKRRKTWNLLTGENGKRRSKLIGTKQQYPTKSAAWEAAEKSRATPAPARNNTVPTVSALVEQYRIEKMPTRYSTRRSYEVWLKNYVLPRWGEQPITALQPRPAEMWLSSLNLSSKSRGHVRGLLHSIWKHAMWSGLVPVEVNPISLVTVRGSSKRSRQPRSLTTEEFRKFSEQLSEPFHSIALLCVCLGLRISECLALKWSDVDWLNGKLAVERGIVRQRIADTKTQGSRRALHISNDLLNVLKMWKQSTEFSTDGDWMFASPAKLGRQPWCYDEVLRRFSKAGEAAGIGVVLTHSMRHTYRSWLDAVGTSVAVQQRLMRHADIRTTMNVYGDIVTDEVKQASGKVAGLALTDRGSDRNDSN
jgi:integrase